MTWPDSNLLLTGESVLSEVELPALVTLSVQPLCPFPLIMHTKHLSSPSSDFYSFPSVRRSHVALSKFIFQGVNDFQTTDSIFK